MLVLLLALVPLASSQVLIGGPMTVDVHRDDIQKMASFAVSQLSELSSMKNGQMKVISARTQVVSGVKYMLSIQVQDGSSERICNVTIWSRPWLGTDLVTDHMCSPERQTRMAGGYQSVDVHRADIQKLASFALEQINQLSNSKNSLEEVVAASEQVVAGMNYRLTIRMKEGSTTQTCNVTVFTQVWTGTRQLTDRNCVSTPPSRRQVMPGGYMTADVHGAEIQKMANFALSQINGLQSAQNSLVEVTSAKTQVVSGMNYNLVIKLKNGGSTQVCDVVIYSQPWTNTLKMTSQQCKQIQKRGLLLGAPHSVDVTDSTVQKMASFAVSELNGLQSQQNSLVKVVSATEQVVAGTNYHLVLSLQNGGQTQVCEVEVWYQAWSSKQVLSKHKCRDSSSKRSVLGGVEQAKLSTEVQDVVSYAENMINSKSNSMFRMVTESVDNIQRQVVAGVKYTFDLTLVTSSCRNDDSNNGKTLQQCPANNNISQRQTCKVTVLAQLWLDPKYRLLSDSCGQFF